MNPASSKYAVILAHNRPAETLDLLNAIKPQVDMTWIIDNASDPPAFEWFTGQPEITDDVIFVRDSTQPPNLAKFMNLGLDQVQLWQARVVSAPSPWKVAIFNDDAWVPEGWFDAVATAMDQVGAAAGCSSPFPGLAQEIFKVTPDADAVNRMFGPAFILRGETKIRADENMKWWFQDTDLDWQARQQGGMIVVPGHTPKHLYPNQSTVENPILGEQAGRDRETFRQKWGWCPW